MTPQLMKIIKKYQLNKLRKSTSTIHITNVGLVVTKENTAPFLVHFVNMDMLYSADASMN